MNTDRRGFLICVGVAAGVSWLGGCQMIRPVEQSGPAWKLRVRPRVRGAFLYPPAEVVLAGRCEDSWAPQQWFTWPGNQFEPDVQRAKFERQIRTIAQRLEVDVRLEPGSLYTDAAIAGWLEAAIADAPDALLLVNFWNSFSPKLKPVLQRWTGPVIVYQPVGANHQLPPEYLRRAPRVQYIHSIEHWEAIERGLRAVRARVAMRGAHLLRVSGRAERRSETAEPFFGTRITTLPAAEFNSRFDAQPFTPELERLVREVRAGASRVTDLGPGAFRDAARAHRTVERMLEEFEADAITIECLFLKHRKPCLSFSLLNSRLVACGCENDLNATLTLMFGAACFGRPGFQHNPEFDTERNLYFGAHCTCTTRLGGPATPVMPYALRPFFHQLPKTVALDVQWPAGERITLLKYHADRRRLDVWGGECLGSPAAPPTGGCATRVLARLDGLADVCDAYGGPHPVLFLGDFVRHAQTFARLYELETRGPTLSATVSVG
ncbi:MAG: hypothetical protein N2652_09780 [Kiritimatiellae bacterium]|nr:hypothetical protein [Kiritimatiellia bacterium]